MWLRKIACVCIFFGSTSIVMGAESWLCTGDQSAGFSVKDGRWQSARFRPSKKYLVKPLPKEYFQYLSRSALELKYGAFEFGKAGPAYCSPDPLYKDTWVCGDFYFNRITLRFLNFFAGGYVRSTDNNDTPNIEIGTCTMLQ